MVQLNLAIAIVSTTAVVALMFVGWFTHRHFRPRHIFNAWDFSVPSIQPHVLRTMTGTIKVPGPNGKKVPFQPQAGFAVPRRDGKGFVFNGDLATGKLFKPGLDSEKPMEGIHPIFAEYALADGRVEAIVRSTTGGGITLKHILIGLCIVGGLVIIVIYQFAKNGGM